MEQYSEDFSEDSILGCFVFFLFVYFLYSLFWNVLFLSRLVLPANPKTQNVFFFYAEKATIPKQAYLVSSSHQKDG